VYSKAGRAHVQADPAAALVADAYNFKKGGEIMQIAVASSNKGEVDRHFGNTDSFSIYELESGSVNLVNSIKVTPYSSGDKGHDFDQEKFDSIHSVLKGCKRLYCTKVGDKPKEELQKRGIEVYSYTGRVENIKL
jgi:nitrogen fixation protein NifX